MRLTMTRSSAQGLHAATVVLVWLLLFLASIGPGLWVAHDFSSAWQAGKALAVWALSGLLVALAARRPDRWEACAWAGVIGVSLIGLYLVTQYRHLGYASKVDVIAVVGNALSRWFPRVAGWAPMPNSLATVLEGALPLAVVLAADQSSRWKRALAAVPAFLIGCGLVLTASRGAWLAVAAGVVIAVGVSASPRLRRSLAVVCLLAVGGTALVLVTSSELPHWASRPDRLDVYANSLAILGEFPFTGIGLGDQFGGVLSRNVLMIQVPFLTYSHNLYLDIWLEQGLPGLSTWIGLVAALVVAVISGERMRLGGRFRGAWCGILVVLVHGLTDARQSVEPWTWAPFFILVGLVCAQLSSAAAMLSSRTALAPLGAALLSVAVVGTWCAPLSAAWQSNLGAVEEARARLGVQDAAQTQAMMASSLSHFHQSLARDPANAVARRRLGVLATEAGAFGAAVEHLGVAWRQDRSDATRKAYGLALTWHGDRAPAIMLLGPLKGMPEELRTWAEWREQRGEWVLAEHARAVAAGLDVGTNR
jgi:O-antigen ligase